MPCRAAIKSEIWTSRTSSCSGVRPETAALYDEYVRRAATCVRLGVYVMMRGRHVPRVNRMMRRIERTLADIVISQLWSTGRMRWKALSEYGCDDGTCM